MKMDLTEVITAAIGLMAALITGFVIPWMRENLSARRRETVSALVTVAVTAAEQLYKSGAGQEKKRYVLELLKQNGYAVDDAVIESAVNRFFGHAAKETER